MEFSLIQIIIFAVVAFLVLTLLMVFILVFAKDKLVASGPVKLFINGENEVEVTAGGTLLSTLGNNKIFLRSVLQS